LILSFLFVFISAGGIFTMPLVMVPRHAVGAAFGFINTAAQFAAFLSPLAVGFVLGATHGDFTKVLYGFVGFFVVAAVAALKIGSPSSVQTRDIMTMQQDPSYDVILRNASVLDGTGNPAFPRRHRDSRSARGQSGLA
jgi:hypothetical protein